MEAKPLQHLCRFLHNVTLAGRFERILVVQRRNRCLVQVVMADGTAARKAFLELRDVDFAEVVAAGREADLNEILFEVRQVGQAFDWKGTRTDGNQFLHEKSSAYEATLWIEITHWSNVRFRPLRRERIRSIQVVGFAKLAKQWYLPFGMLISSSSPSITS